MRARRKQGDKPPHFDRVLIDMNTQCDLLLPKGAVPVTNRTEVLSNIRRLMVWTRVRRIPIISSIECHRPGEITKGMPMHCMDREAGQRKLPFTLMPRRIMLDDDNTLDVPHGIFSEYQQLIFTKRDTDIFSNPKVDRLLEMFTADLFIVCGTVTEYSIVRAVLGLICRMKQPVVVTDACGHFSAGDSEYAFRKMMAKRALLTTTTDILTGKCSIMC